jgi:hypothetical protein
VPSDPQDWLDQMWHAGYCDETVRRCSETALNSGGSKQRLEWMQRHTPICHDCLYANFMKNQEAAIAEELGFLEEFMNGGSVTQKPGFQEKLKECLDAKIDSTMLRGTFRAWMDRVSERHGKPWPGRVQ